MVSSQKMLIHRSDLNTEFMRRQGSKIPVKWMLKHAIWKRVYSASCFKQTLMAIPMLLLLLEAFCIFDLSRLKKKEEMWNASMILCILEIKQLIYQNS